MPPEPPAIADRNQPAARNIGRCGLDASLSASPSRGLRPGSRGGPSGTRVVFTSSGGPGSTWPSDWARTGAISPLGMDSVQSLDGRHVPCGATAGAMAIV